MGQMFYDSWGSLWVTCDCDHPEAKAFGPCGCAREIETDMTIRQAEELGLTETDDSGWIYRFQTPLKDGWRQKHSMSVKVANAEGRDRNAFDKFLGRVQSILNERGYYASVRVATRPDGTRVDTFPALSPHERFVVEHDLNAAIDAAEIELGNA